MTFRHNRHFRRYYDRLFKKDPAVANMMLLLSELADDKGFVRFGAFPEMELQELMTSRFENIWAYQLPGGLKG